MFDSLCSQFAESFIGDSSPAAEVLVLVGMCLFGMFVVVRVQSANSRHMRFVLALLFTYVMEYKYAGPDLHLEF